MIAGLGNPGKRYENTRHNVGFCAVDCISRRFNVAFKKVRFDGDITEIMHQGKKIILVKPLTYMNNSGDCIRKVTRFYKLSLECLVIIYDDIDIPVGTLRIRQSGGAGTHNGMRSVIDELGDEGFPRIRIGIGKPPDYFDLKDYVLTGFSDHEKLEAERMISEAAIAAIDIVEFGAEKSMNLHNSRKL
ncbi:MAG: aminoacyl-tRNA hydrolase [Oscillospiraceae bacterium]|nr:aminoacyl-tRNA hydrolase [Oscillospiraceae bacterium]